jgi:ribosomal protein L7/L12
MKIVIQRSVKDQVDNFFEWLKGRAVNEDHETNKDLIADFVDRVMVFEMKKLANTDESFEEEIEIPNQALMEPLLEAKKEFDKSFEKILRENNITEDVPEEEEEDEEEKKEDAPEEENKEEWLNEVKDYLNNGKIIQAIKLYREKANVGLKEAKEACDVLRGMVPPPQDPVTLRTIRSGNGHKVGIKRKMNSAEKDLIRAEFMNKNGLAENDYWVGFKKGKIDDEIGIFQITGFVSYLHRQVAFGSIDLPNLPEYISWMKTKRDLWAQYNSPKYTEYRNRRANHV